ncbi:hypothetical protein ACLIBH_00650 [Virgibacillus sp. W0430]
MQIEGFSAIMDTIGTLIWIAPMLGVLTIIFNIIALIVCTKEEAKNHTA